MKLSRARLREIIKEELEVILTDDEAAEMFDEALGAEAPPPAAAPKQSARTQRMAKAGQVGGQQSAEDVSAALITTLKGKGIPAAALKAGIADFLKKVGASKGTAQQVATSAAQTKQKGLE